VLSAATAGTANAPVVPLPKIVAATRIGNEFTLSFSTLPYFRYQVEASPDLVAWPTFGEVIPGDGTVKTITDDMTGVTKKFFRVRRLP
jgi:hypothetical protein